MNKSFLSMCAGPLLLALAVNAADYNAPAPTPSPTYSRPVSRYSGPTPTYRSDSSDSSDSSDANAGPNDDYTSPVTTPSPTTEIYPDLSESYEAEVTPEPVMDTPAPTPDMETTSGPTEYYVETTEDGDMEKMPTSDGGSEEEEEEEEEPLPMENPEDGMSCSTYDEDVDVATILPETCEWNTYMCCWTGHDGSKGMYGNADVCRVLDYPEEGDVLELPRDDEGPVYCHGFAWADDADIDSHILPLYHYVTNVNRTDDGGYYGNVEGVPSCGCIEDMPVVSDAACSK
ncbi:unnamed protein product [Ectocarpus sp. 8 AP-2014]